MLATSKNFLDKDFGRDSPQPRASHRSQLHTSSTLDWLKKRHSKTASTKYLLLPEEQQHHADFLNVFENFDADNSGKLTIGEFINMLKHLNISVNKEDLKEFYRRVDDNNDTELDFREFKNCTLSNEANFYFSQMMERAKEIKTGSEGNDPRKILKSPTRKEFADEEGSSKPFLPRTFGNLLHYLTYASKKKDIINFVNNESNNLDQKFEKFAELFDLEISKDQFLQQANKKGQSSFRTLNTGQSFSSKGSTSLPKSDMLMKSFDFKSPDNFLQDPYQKNDKEKEKFMKELTKISARAEQQAKEEIEESRQKMRHKKSLSTCSPTAGQLSRTSLNQTNAFTKSINKFNDDHTPKVGSIFLDEAKTPPKGLRDGENFSHFAEQTGAMFKTKSQLGLANRFDSKNSFDLSPHVGGSPSEMVKKPSISNRRQSINSTLEKTPPLSTPIQNFSHMLLNIFPQSPEKKVPTILTPVSRKLPSLKEEVLNHNQSLPQIVVNNSYALPMSRKGPPKEEVNKKLYMSESLHAPSIRIIRENELTPKELVRISASQVVGRVPGENNVQTPSKLAQLDQKSLSSNAHLLFPRKSVNSVSPFFKESKQEVAANSPDVERKMEKLGEMNERNHVHLKQIVQKKDAIFTISTPKGKKKPFTIYRAFSNEPEKRKK